VSGKRFTPPDAVQAKLETLPQKPGVYLMKNAAGEILYIGKAVNLRARVRSYFHRSAQRNARIRRFIQDIADIDWIVVDTELEALVLENQLIKKHQPRYNVRLKDDKTYPYIKIHWQDPFPKVSITRRVESDGAKYYGPYASAWAVRQTLDVLRRVFPYLTCNRTITGQDTRACLYYDIKRCAGPCIGAVSQEEYRKIVAGLARFLEGDTESVIAELEAEMHKAAQALQFERAALLRDQIAAARQIASQQQVVAQGMTNEDVLAIAQEGDMRCVQVFFIRRGKLLGRETFFLEGSEDADVEEALASFIQQFYDTVIQPPSHIVLPQDLQEAEIIQKWLTKKSGTLVHLHPPQDERQEKLVHMATTNALEAIRAMRYQQATDKLRQEHALQELQQVLGLDSPPARIEGYDVSTLQGTHTVGVMVVFEHGVPRKSDYRRFNIRGVQSVLEPNDFAAMRETLRRRLRRLVEEATADPGHKARRQDRVWKLRPDLILIDGGKGQLHVALEVLEEFGLREVIPVVALAKREELLYLPDWAEPLRLSPRSEALKLLQRVRDEAHRFSVVSHRQRRRKESLRSTLEEIPGIGPKRRKALLRHFGSVEAIRQASVEELAQVPGMNRRVAETLKAHLTS